MRQFKTAVCGATFDLFHKGHKAFLRFILSHADHVLLGLTSDAYIAVQKPVVVEAYSSRKRILEEFLRSEEALDRVEIAPIDSVYIPKQWEDSPIDVMIVTEDSKNGASLVNQKRAEEGKGELAVVVFPLVASEDGKPISSSRIRQGEINRDGRLWIKPEWSTYVLMLPEQMRQKFREPLGAVYTDSKDILSAVSDGKFITVGDVTTRLYYELGKEPYLAIIDFIVERKQQYTSLSQLSIPKSVQLEEIENPAGTISPKLFLTLQRLLHAADSKKRFVIRIHGEEDLAALPTVLAAPLGFSLCYGQPGEGTVVVSIDEESKQRVYELVSLMQPQK